MAHRWRDIRNRLGKLSEERMAEIDAEVASELSDDKKRALEKLGGRVTTVSEFLGLTPAETEHVEQRLQKKRRPDDHCGAEPVRSERWDAYFCATCGEWLEDCCDDPRCDFCVGRPPRADRLLLSE